MCRTGASCGCGATSSGPLGLIVAAAVALPLAATAAAWLAGVVGSVAVWALLAEGVTAVLGIVWTVRRVRSVRTWRPSGRTGGQSRLQLQVRPEGSPRSLPAGAPRAIEAPRPPVRVVLAERVRDA